MQPQPQSQPGTERRAHVRYALPAMHTSICVHRLDAMSIKRLEGHVYDISEGGIRFELDEPLELDETIHFLIDLPAGGGNVSGLARIVRVHQEDDDPGPRRMAVRILRFDEPSDRLRLVNCFDHTPLREAA